MILDIGCGINPKGDVNVDLILGADYGSIRTKANVIASVYNLPFQDKSFSTVYFSGLLHHLSSPITALKEINRICSEVIIGLEPNFTFLFPRDKTEFKHNYRKGELWKIVSSVSCRWHTIDRIITINGLFFRIVILK